MDTLSSSGSSFEASVVGLPLKSSCANCSLTLTANSFVAFYKLTNELTMSVCQGVHLVFNSSEAPGDSPVSTNLKLCKSCGESFGKLLRLFTNFTQTSFPGSYVHKLLTKSERTSTEASEECVIKTESNEDAFSNSTDCYLEDEEIVPECRTMECSSNQNVRRSSRLTTQNSSKKRKYSPELIQSRTRCKTETSATDTSTEYTPVKAIRKGKKNILTDGPSRKYVKKSETKAKPPKGIKIFVCETCGKSFRNKIWLSMHRAGHTGDRPFSCDDCHLHFATPRDLKRHLYRRHPNENPRKKMVKISDADKELLIISDYKCDTCKEVSFASFKEWILHQEECHHFKLGYDKFFSEDVIKIQNGLYRPCPRCGKKTKSNEHMLLHIKTVHLEDRPFSCELCPKSFVSEHCLKNHVDAVHVTERKFLCTLCGESFKLKNYLEFHEKTHFGLIKKHVECDICDSKFESKYKLSNHKASVHSEERPFACDQCGGRFKLEGMLNQHKRKVHEKKFIIDQFCEHCGKGYAFKEKLKDHLMSVHKLSKEDARVSAKMKPASIFRILPNGERVMKQKPTKPKTCQYCQRTYVRREQLFTHMISVHSKTEAEAKEITGLESKRNLLPGAGAGSRKKKKSDSPEQLAYL